MKSNNVQNNSQNEQYPSSWIEAMKLQCERYQQREMERKQWEQEELQKIKDYYEQLDNNKQ